MDDDLGLLPVSLEDWMDKFGDEFGYMPMTRVLETSSYQPGTPERVGQMRRRLRAGQPLFSKGDPTLSGFPSPYASDPVSTCWEGTQDHGFEQSSCSLYRYRSWYQWDSQLPVCLFIGLVAEHNPDPVLHEKLTKLATEHGCGAYQRVNLFALRCKDAQSLWQAEDPVGDWNDRVIRLAMLACDFAVCCWGRAGGHLGRGAIITSALRYSLGPERIYCYGLSQAVASSDGQGRRVRQPIGIGKVLPGSKLVCMPLDFVEDASHD